MARIHASQLWEAEIKVSEVTNPSDTLISGF